MVAADYIRNLRDEVKKGFYGRLKQGFYPLPAPRGYLDRGKAKAKVIDPVLGPLIRRGFELYGTGNHGLHTLRIEMARQGLVSSNGAPLGLASMSNILRNPFYVGLIRIARTNEIFEGNHEPLVSKALFDRVQAILSGRLYARTQIHRFLFRRLIRCGKCGRSLSGERQKGHVYYRCHDYGCRGVSLAETQIDAMIRADLAALRVDDGDVVDFRGLLAEHIAEEDAGLTTRAREIERDLGLVAQRLQRLTDALLDGTIDKLAFDERKAALLERRATLKDRRDSHNSTFWRSIAERFELGLTALQGYEIGNADEKREILKSVSSNLLARGNQPVFPMFSPFAELREWTKTDHGAPYRSTVRTRSRDRRWEMMRRFLATLAESTGGIQTTPNEAETKAITRRSYSRPPLPKPVTRRARGSSREAA